MIAGDTTAAGYPTAAGAPTFLLTARTDEPCTEIFVVDQQFQILPYGKGVGELKVNVAPGVYIVKFKAGDSTREVVKPIFADTVVSCPPLAFGSPAPLAGTSPTTQHIEHQKAAWDASLRVHVTLTGRHKPTEASESQIFVFIRDLAPDQVDGPCSDMALCDLETGKVLVNLHENGENNPPLFPYRWKGCTIALKPGGYRLRVQTETVGRLEQIVVAAAGWQTQVFLLRRTYGNAANGSSNETATGDVRADLCGGSIFMNRIGTGWNGDEPASRLTELARQALDTRRENVMSPGDLRDVSLRNPMLAIYACHLLLLASSPNLDLLGQITDVLRQKDVLGESHPDVEALRLALPSSTSTVVKSFAVPPMLRRSGEILNTATATQPELVPAGSLAARAAPFVWGDGVWLVARNVPEEVPAELPPGQDETPVPDVRRGIRAGRVTNQEVYMAAGMQEEDDVPESFSAVHGDGEPSSPRHTATRGSRQTKRALETVSHAPLADVLAQAIKAVLRAVEDTKAAQPANRSEASGSSTDAKDEWNLQREVRLVSRSYRLSPLETNLLGILYGWAKAPHSPKENTFADLIPALRVPYATLETATMELIRKLKTLPVPPKETA